MPSINTKLPSPVADFWFYDWAIFRTGRGFG